MLPLPSGTVVAAVAAQGVLLGLFSVLMSWRANRKVIRTLQQHSVSMPPWNPILGHLKVMQQVVSALPSNAYAHLVFMQLGKLFPKGIFYVDLWPFSRPLMVVAFPNGTAQVEAMNLDKPMDVFSKVDILTSGPSMLTTTGDVWKRWRRSFNAGFSERHVQGLVPVVAEEVAVFRSMLSEYAKEKKLLILEDLTLKLTFDIIAITTLNTRLQCQIKPHPLVSAFRRQIEWTDWNTSFNPLSLLSPIRPLVHWYSGRKVNRLIHAEIDREISNRIQERESADSSKPSNRSILSVTVDQYLDNSFPGMSRSDFKRLVTPQLRVFLFAGHDTTSSTLIYCIHMLSTHPSALRRVREEHDSVFGVSPSSAQELISGDGTLLNQLPFTTAVIKETLRLYSPGAAMRQGRAGAHVVDDDGNQYPTEGCNVWVLTSILHRNPEIWTRPKEFLPERWLTEPGDELHPPKGGWRAFEAGPRNCIGQTLAMMELRIALVLVVREFEFRSAYEEWDALNGERKGPRHVDGARAYYAARGGGGGHPDQGYPCRVVARELVT